MNTSDAYIALEKLNLTALTGKSPHPSHGGWLNFLKGVDVREVHNDVIYLGSSNCNYIVFPTGEIFENFGFNGKKVMRKIQEEGWLKVLNSIKLQYKETI